MPSLKLLVWLMKSEQGSLVGKSKGEQVRRLAYPPVVGLISTSLREISGVYFSNRLEKLNVLLVDERMRMAGLDRRWRAASLRSEEAMRVVV